MLDVDRRRRAATSATDTTTATSTRTSGSTPLLLADVGDAVGRRAGRARPDHAAAYAANAADLRADLTALDAAFTAGLADCERHVVVSATTRSATWAKYGLDVAADRRPDPRRRAHPGRPRPTPAS